MSRLPLPPGAVPGPTASLSSSSSSGAAPAVQAPSPQSQALAELIAREIGENGGWIGFERYMALALYTPGLGYYARDSRKFGSLPSSGSDFVTAPELGPLFARALARQLAQALAATGTRELWEFGAGSGALAAGLLAELGDAVERYTIVDLSATLRERQRATVAQRAPAQAHKLVFADRWPDALHGVVVANELLDAMPVLLLAHDGESWRERGVALAGAPAAADHAPAAPRFVWADRPTEFTPPLDMSDGGAEPLAGCLTEIGRQGTAFVSSLAERLRRGAVFLIDYGFPESEYYHPQRSGGTLVAHRAHLVETDPAALLAEPGDKDLTAHVDFTAVAVAAQDAGLDVLGYTSQARFLFNCGIADDLAALQQAGDYAGLARAHKLVAEHEMGELFKVLGLAASADDFGEAGALGFAVGDRSHRL
jgi:SAM-dependent MidA family methyltransferase